MKLSSPLILILCASPVALGRLGDNNDNSKIDPSSQGRALRTRSSPTDINAMQAFNPDGGSAATTDDKKTMIFDFDVYIGADPQCTQEQVDKFQGIMLHSVVKCNEKLPEIIEDITGNSVNDIVGQANELKKVEDGSDMGSFSWYYSGSSSYSRSSNRDWFAFDPKDQGQDDQGQDDQGQDEQEVNDLTYYVLSTAAKVEAEQVVEYQDIVKSKQELIATLGKEMNALEALCMDRMESLKEKALKMASDHKVEHDKVEASGFVEDEVKVLLKALAQKEEPETDKLSTEFKETRKKCKEDIKVAKKQLKTEVADLEKSQEALRKEQQEHLKLVRSVAKEEYKKAHPGAEDEDDEEEEDEDDEEEEEDEDDDEEEEDEEDEEEDQDAPSITKKSASDTTPASDEELLSSITKAMAMLGKKKADAVMEAYKVELRNMLTADLKEKFAQTNCFSGDGPKIELDMTLDTN